LTGHLQELRRGMFVMAHDWTYLYNLMKLGGSLGNVSQKLKKKIL
jgi:hypothetical protein